MKKYFIDTNVFLRVIAVESLSQRDDCLAFFHKVKHNKIKVVTSTEVLAEVVWVLKSYYKLSKSKICESVRSIINLKGLKLVQSNRLKEAVEIYETKSVKFIDAMIASIKPIYEKKWVVVSYDKDFDKIGVIRMEPKNI